MIYQFIRKNFIQANINYKAYYDKKANTSKLKEAVYVYVLQPKADHQGSKIPFTDFRWRGPYIVEDVLLKNNYLVRKIDTNKTQVLHRMRMPEFASRQPPADIRITSQKWKPDSEVSLKHDDLYARAWECEYKKPNFDAENSNETAPTSPEIPVKSDLLTEETRNTPGTEKGCSPEMFPQTEHLCDVTDTYPDMEPDVETSPEQPNNSPINPRSSKTDFCHNPKPNCSDEFR